MRANPNLEREESLLTSQEDLKALHSNKHVSEYQFTKEQQRFLEDQGYLIIKNLIPKETCQQFVQEVVTLSQKYYSISLDDPLTWNPQYLGFLDVWHNPTYYQLRQNPKLYSIFAQLLHTHRITVSLDRICLKPPYFIEKTEGQRIEFPQYHSEFGIHTDMNLWDLDEMKYQGSISLVDTPIGHGGFRCIPGFHKLNKIREYRKRYERGDFHNGVPQTPPDVTDPSTNFVWFSDKELIKNEVVEIPMEQGDVMIWSNRIPHANAVSHSNKWRIQCYVRFIPANDKHEEYRKEVARSINTGEKPRYFSTGNATADTRYASQENIHFEQQNYKLPELTWLGQRIFGLKDWE